MNDPYTYSNGVLKNKLNIKEYEKLNKAEADIGFLKLMDIDSFVLNSFDEISVKNVHKHIFEDIFDWAGEFRTVPVFKEELVLPGISLPYSEPKNIKNDLKVLLEDLNNTDWYSMDEDTLCTTFARKLALIWRVHPFRDGNTRTTLSFAYKFAQAKGFPFDIDKFANELNRKYVNGNVVQYSVRDRFVLACLDEKDYPEVEYLAAMFKNALLNKTQEEHKTNIKMH